MVRASDAAHVSPPVCGQSITTGFLEVIGFSWRLATALSAQNASKDPNPLFDAWELEGRSHIKQVLAITMAPGARFDKSDRLKILWRDRMLWIVQNVPGLNIKVVRIPGGTTEVSVC